MQRLTLVVFAVMSILGCAHENRPTAIAADPDILRAALREWQEGPTDGRICLDPRVFARQTSARSSGEDWSDTVLTALMADTLVAVDTTVGARGRAVARPCAPTSVHPRIALGVPTVRGDTAEIESAAFPPASTSIASVEVHTSAIVVRQAGGWVVVAHPNRDFKPLTPPR